MAVISLREIIRETFHKMKITIATIWIHSINVHKMNKNKHKNSQNMQIVKS